MSYEPQLFRVDPASQETKRIEEVNFSQLGFRERRDIQEWVAANPGILGVDLLIIGKEFSGFDRTNERLDLLAVDSDGTLVVIELKRDDTGANDHWQAIKYASYFRRTASEQIVDMLADYRNIPHDKAWEVLVQHLGSDDLNALNKKQRIILASHRFAPEVTSAALWLNDRTPDENLITCVTLTPYRDSNTDALYLQSTTIIPVPGEDVYLIGVGDRQKESSNSGNSTFAANLKRTFQRNINDDVTPFVKKVGQLTLDELEGSVRPDRVGKWAAGQPDFRYYNLWYSRSPWRNHVLCYRVTLRPEEENRWRAIVRFKDEKKLTFSSLDGIVLHESQQRDDEGIFARVGSDTLNEDFASRIAEVLRRFIQQITPIVDALDDENNEEEA